MRPKERRETGQTDLLRSRLDAIIDMNHALVKLSRTIDWSFFELLNRAREILVRLAKGAGIKLRQSYGRVGKFALIKQQRYAMPSSSSAPTGP